MRTEFNIEGFSQELEIMNSTTEILAKNRLPRLVTEEVLSRMLKAKFPYSYIPVVEDEIDLHKLPDVELKSLLHLRATSILPNYAVAYIGVGDYVLRRKAKEDEVFDTIEIYGVKENAIKH